MNLWGGIKEHDSVIILFSLLNCIGLLGVSSHKEAVVFPISFFVT